ncbi:MAG: hypothetical protein IJZ59_07290, partial [Alphaproteobacteria bacterium]|nr:hypothetical protein [Alphaproteobacteria bacterium]
MKISPLSVLLATTFLSTNALAINAGDLGTSENVKWKEVFSSTDNTVVVETPEGAKYFQYTYTPAGRTVYNEGIENVTGNIDADFIGINGGRSEGNAIYTGGNITSVTGDFINNSASLFAIGGFIYNSTNIQNIKGDFISNIVYGNYSVSGAGITNEGFINNIEGDFIGNRANIDRYTQSNAAYGYDTFGGVIYNDGDINNIAGNFIGNSIYFNNFKSGGGYVSSYGGAIANEYGTIETITGDAIGNYIKTNGDGYGGFLDNAAHNPNVLPASLNLSVMSGSNFYNIGSINGNIISNHVLANQSAYGGAISNRMYGSIAEINSDSISYNHAIYDGSLAQPVSLEPLDYDPFSDYYGGAAYGGAIYNEGSIGNITASISNNYAGAGYALGGAILNESIIQSINGNISSNYAISGYVSYGGAIYTSSTYSTVYIGDIIGDIVGNYAISQEEARGGFLYQIRQRIERIDEYSARIGNIIGNINNNHAAGSYYADGGAIYNYWSVIENITGNISNNYVYSSDGYATGGAISNNGGKISNITGNFTKNYAYGYNEALGGAIYNVDYDWLDTGVGIDLISGSIIGNYAKSEGYAFGGAIFNEGGDLTFAANGEKYKISGNYTQDRRGKINNAIWMQNSEYHGPSQETSLEPESVNISLLNNSNYEPFVPSLNFKVTKNGSYTIDDQIDGGYYYGMVGYDNSDYEPVERYGYGYNLNISGAACPQCEWNSVRFNNLVNNVNNLTITKSQMALGKDATINIVNDYIAKQNPYLRLDLDAVNGKVGQLKIGGEVEGTTSVVVNVLQ